VESNTQPTFYEISPLISRPCILDTAYGRAFIEANTTVIKELGDGARSSGTTAITAHIIGDMLHLGNVGDSRAILGIVRDGSVASASSGGDKWAVAGASPPLLFPCGTLTRFHLMPAACVSIVRWHPEPVVPDTACACLSPYLS